jgi:Uma2 family endonuclease
MAQELETLSERTPVKPNKMTYEKFLECAEGMHAEWVNGEVIYTIPASRVHQNLAGFIFVILRFFVEYHGLGQVLSAPFQMKTGRELPGREPDVMFVSNERLSSLQTNHLEGPADLVVEVVSAESRERDRGAKFYEYEAGGIREYWLIDPLRRQAEFYRLSEDGIYQLVPVGADGVYRSTVLEGLWVKVSWFWDETMPPVREVVNMWKLS